MLTTDQQAPGRQAACTTAAWTSQHTIQRRPQQGIAAFSGRTQTREAHSSSNRRTQSTRTQSEAEQTPESGRPLHNSESIGPLGGHTVSTC